MKYHSQEICFSLALLMTVNMDESNQSNKDTPTGAYLKLNLQPKRSDILRFEVEGKVVWYRRFCNYRFASDLRTEPWIRYTPPEVLKNEILHYIRSWS